MTKSDILTELEAIANDTLPSSGNVTSAEINNFANKVIDLMLESTKAINPDTKPYPTIKF